MSIIAISDVHLGYKLKGVNQSNKADFDLFLKDVASKLSSDDIFVMCGDVLDMWRRDMAGVEIENADTLLQLQELNAKVYYVVGNHDYHLDYLQEMLPFEFTKEKTLPYGGRTYVFKHGYDFDPLVKLFEKNGFDWLCHQHEDLKEKLSNIYEQFEFEMKERKIVPTKRRLSKHYIEKFNLNEIEGIEFEAPKILGKKENQSIAKKFELISDLKEMVKPVEERLSEEELKNITSKAQKEIGKVKDGVLVYGHTHRPFITENVVNLGSWVKTQKISDTYLEIKNGGMKLMIYENGEIKK